MPSFQSLIATILLLALTRNADATDQWHFDRDNVTVGGAIVLLAPDGYKPGDALLLIDGKETGNLSGLGLEISTDHGFAYLLWWQPAQSGDTDARTHPIRPIFAHPGTIEVAIRERGTDTQVGRIQVERLCADCQKAIDLLYPKFGEKEGANEREYVTRWPRFLADPVEYCSITRTKPAPPLSDSDRDDLLQHPDWAEVIPALLSYCRFRIALQEYLQALSENAYDRARVTPLTSDGEETQILRTNYRASFARALKDKARKEADQHALVASEPSDE